MIAKEYIVKEYGENWTGENFQWRSGDVIDAMEGFLKEETANLTKEKQDAESAYAGVLHDTTHLQNQLNELEVFEHDGIRYVRQSDIGKIILGDSL